MGLAPPFKEPFSANNHSTRIVAMAKSISFAFNQRRKVSQAGRSNTCCFDPVTGNE